MTLVFSDIEGSTRVLQRSGEAYADLLSAHRDLIREAFRQHDAFEVDMQGDAFFVTFASASDAAAAAADAQRALAAHDWPDDNEIRVRMGLHTGEPRLIGDRYVGDRRRPRRPRHGGRAWRTGARLGVDPGACSTTVSGSGILASTGCRT